MMATIQNSAAHGGGLAGGRARRGGGRGRGAATVRGAGNGGKGEGDGAGTGGGAAGNRRRRRGRDEAEEVEDDEAAEGSEDGVGEEVKWLGLYSSTQSILLVGEGNFSFSLALATAFGSGGNIVATSLDTSEALRNKYGGAESNITSLKRLGATVLHGIDVKTMKSHTDLRNRRFDRIVYNFPHAGFKGKECEVHMIKLHKNLVRGFFRNACHLLRPYGEVHVSHKTGKSYDKWNLEHVAAGFSLILIEKVGPFCVANTAVGGARVGQRGADLTRPSPGDAICWAAVANTSPCENGLAPGHLSHHPTGRTRARTAVEQLVQQKVTLLEPGMEKLLAREKGPVKRLNHYNSSQSILTVGDGDFSFSLALARAFGSGANLVATSLDSSHKELVAGFFSNAHHLLGRYGEIHVSNKTGHPYDSRDLENLASKSSLVLFKKVVFHKGDYPGYNQKRGDGPKCNKSFKLGPCCTFKFQISEAGRSGNSGA
nr:unnamed protein product [Digitaria exilis]